jgi:hypothetical protein
LTDSTFDGEVAFTDPSKIVNSHWMNDITIESDVIARAGRGLAHCADAMSACATGDVKAAWGTPIPIIYCHAVRAANDKLLIKLPAAFYAQPRW